MTVAVRGVSEQCDLAEAISPVQGRPGRAVHAYRGGSLDDQVEVVAGLALADDDRAGREVARFGFGREQFGLLPGGQRVMGCAAAALPHGSRVRGDEARLMHEDYGLDAVAGV